ncbi:MAG: hypothetical protein ACU0DI_15205 [Paracoccaceae bacterium]
MQKKIWIGAVVALVALASCGDTLLEQGLIGAGAGAGTAIVLGGDATTGAVLGAGVNIYCQTSTDLC